MKMNKKSSTIINKEELLKEMFNYQMGIKSLLGNSVEEIAKDLKVSPEEVREGLKDFCRKEADKYGLNYTSRVCIKLDHKTKTAEVISHKRFITGVCVVN